ncbi:MAG: DUF5684 domain-containing protein [bacterium]
MQRGGGGGIIGLIYLLIIILLIVSMWKVFVKAGEPGWAAIIPIYNIVVLFKIAGKPVWWVILFLIPLVNFVITILAYLAFAAKFGKGAGFAIGLAFLPMIFFPILAFGDAEYQSA